MTNKHIHSYKRVNLRADKSDKPYYVYACQLSLCPHYLPPALVLGKLCQCSRCDKAFKLEKHHLLLVEPHCDGCTVRRIDMSEL